MNPLYLIEHQGRRARYFIETDRDENSRSHVIGLIRTGEVSPVKVLEIDEEAGSCRDVTEEIMTEVAALLVPVFPDVPCGFDHERDRRKHELPPSNIHPVSLKSVERV